jgi:hypothetical protein
MKSCSCNASSVELFATAAEWSSEFGLLFDADAKDEILAVFFDRLRISTLARC